MKDWHITALIAIVLALWAIVGWYLAPDVVAWLRGSNG